MHFLKLEFNVGDWRWLKVLAETCFVDFNSPNCKERTKSWKRFNIFSSKCCPYLKGFLVKLVFFSRDNQHVQRESGLCVCVCVRESKEHALGAACKFWLGTVMQPASNMTGSLAPRPPDPLSDRAPFNGMQWVSEWRSEGVLLLSIHTIKKTTQLIHNIRHYCWPS